MLLAKGMFIYLLCITSETAGTETLQSKFPSLPCQLPVRSVNGKHKKGLGRWKRRIEGTSRRPLPPRVWISAGWGVPAEVQATAL